ncbi:MAG TPA: hypothetical protein VFG23_19075 [Polyangia bacterium]|nr:hypothetical protein [Polyangia bacterium]
MARPTMRGGLLLLAAMAVGCGGNSRKSRAPDAGGWTTVPPAHDAGASDRAAVDGKTSHDASPDVMARDARPDSQPAHDAASDAKTAHDARPDALLLAPMGGSCATGATCASGFCADGVCCNVACAGACVSCAVTGRVGTCWPIDAGAPDPHATCLDQGVKTCGRDGTCDGVGGCALYPARSACAQSFCTGNVWTPPATCDGAGVCVTGPSLVCTPYACVNGGCYADCIGPDACAVGASCVDSSCRGTGSLDGLCSVNAECLTDVCAQGVCCASTCDGVCSSCALPGSLGTCTPVPAGQRPDGSVCP